MSRKHGPLGPAWARKRAPVFDAARLHGQRVMRLIRRAERGLRSGVSSKKPPRHIALGLRYRGAT